MDVPWAEHSLTNVEGLMTIQYWITFGLGIICALLLIWVAVLTVRLDTAQAALREIEEVK